jgi:hypothetical protein
LYTERGLSLRDIGDAHGVSTQTVRRWLIHAGRIPVGRHVLVDPVWVAISIWRACGQLSKVGRSGECSGLVVVVMILWALWGLTGLDDHELAHHAAVFVFEDVAVEHVGGRRARLRGETQEILINGSGRALRCAYGSRTGPSPPTRRSCTPTGS